MRIRRHKYLTLAITAASSVKDANRKCRARTLSLYVTFPRPRRTWIMSASRKLPRQSGIHRPDAKTNLQTRQSTATSTVAVVVHAPVPELAAESGLLVHQPPQCHAR